MRSSLFRACLAALLAFVSVQAIAFAHPHFAEACTSNPAFGSTILCALTSAGEVDTFTFTASAGDRVLVRLGMADSSRLPRIQVYAPSTTLACQAQSNGNVADTDVCTLTESGTHTIKVSSSNSQTGNYGLSLQRLNNPTGATAVSFGQSETGGLTAPGEIATYALLAEAGDALVVRMTTTTIYFPPLIRIYAPNGTKVCSASSNSHIAETGSCLAPATGTYTLILTANATNASGNYGIALQRTNQPIGAVSLGFGAPINATLATHAELDAYSFTGEAQQTIVLRMAGATPVSPQIRVYRPDGGLQCSTYSYSRIADTACQLPTTGTYTILANAFSSPDTGSYGLSLQRIAPGAAATALDAGITATATLTTPGQLASFVFEGTANEPVYLRMGALQANVKPLVRLFADDGVLVCSAHSYGYAIDVGPCLLPHTGTYTVLTTAFETPVTGAFGLTMQRLDQPGNVQTLYFNRVQRGTLTTSATLGTHSFTAAGGSTVKLQMTETGASIKPAVQIFSADGTRLCMQTSYGAYAEIASCFLPSDGVYTVLASSIDDSTGGYELALTCLTGTCGALAPPEEHVYLPLVQRSW